MTDADTKKTPKAPAKAASEKAAPKKAPAKKVPAKKTAPKKTAAPKPAPKPKVDDTQGDLLDGLDIGRRLERARKAKKMTLQQASRQTQIRAETLQALEENRFEELPEVVYVRGFIRIYAQVLDLDAAELLRDLSRYLKTEEQTTLILPTPVEEGTLPSLKTIILSVAVVFLMGAIWWVVDRPTHNVIGEGAETPQPEKLATLPDEVREFVTTEPTPAPAFERPVNIAPAEPAPKAEAPQLPEVATTPTRVKLKATEDVWLSVYKSGAELPVYAGLLKANEDYNVPDESGLLLDVGLPPALTVYVDGKKMGISGVIDRRVRALPLNADYLANTYYPEEIYKAVNITLPSTPPKAKNVMVKPTAKTTTSTAAEAQAETQKAIVEVPQVVIQEESVPLALPTP